MKFTLNVDSANTLIKYAKAYVWQDNPKEIYRMVKIELDGKDVKATMLTDVSAATCVFRNESPNPDNGKMFIRTPTTLFKQRDDIITVEDTDTATVYTTSGGRLSLPKVKADDPSFISVEPFFRGDALATLWMDGKLLARSIDAMGNSVKVEFLGEKRGLRLTSITGEAIVLPLRPIKDGKEIK